MTRWSSPLLLAAALVALPAGQALAAGYVEEGCDADGDSRTDGLDDALTTAAAQEWSIANTTALSMASSPLTSPAPYKLLRPSISLELNQFDSLKCTERTAYLGSSHKTEDTNKTPIIPMFKVSLGLPFSYVSVFGLPPVPLFGVRTGVIGGEVGAGYRIPVIGLKPGLRVHATGGQVVGDIAHALTEDEPAVADEYQFFNFGADVSLAWELQLPALDLAPYVGAGYLNVSSIFYVGDDGYTVFTGDYFLKYYHEEARGPEGGPYPGYAGLDAFLGVRAAFRDHFEGALEGFFIPVRLAADDDPRLLTADGRKSAYVTNFVSIRARVGYIF